MDPEDRLPPEDRPSPEVRLRENQNQRAIEEQKKLYTMKKAAISTAIQDIEVVLDEMDRELVTMKSRHKSSQKSSQRSCASNESRYPYVLKKKAEAEAAKASLNYIDREAELKRKQLELEIELDKLAKLREAEVTGAQYDAIREYDATEKSSVPYSDIKERTRQYVLDQEQYLFDPSALEDAQQSAKCREKTKTVHDVTQQPTKSNEAKKVETKISENVPVNEFSRYLLKKDMLLSRFTKFNDKPETFPTWKKSFKNITEELAVTPFEESDLLVKWLGPKSSSVAQSIKSSNICDPATGLRKIWDRLDDCYGCPEMVESSLRKRLEQFPKITKDMKQLFDLHDILAEVLALKQDPKMSVLAYFDSSAGVNPIVNKLPPVVKGKWRDRAFTFKEKHVSVFPPFSFFVDFIYEMARRYNDPGFDFEVNQSQAEHHQKPVKVSAKKTDLGGSRKPLKCILHEHSYHSLNECKVFKTKPLDEKRKLLQDHGVCFKCCNGRDHLKQNCKEDVVCGECSSKFHCTAMHTIPVAPRFSNSGARNQGGEAKRPPQGETSQVRVDNSCTEICGGDFGGKSCAKILPVYVVHRSDPSIRLKTYAILDEQSNRSLAKEELFDYFSVDCQPEQYTLNSCSGKTIMTGRKADGFSIEALSGDATMQLPTLIECGEIPSNREEIPTPEVTRYHNHLHDLTGQLYPVGEGADILLLIGRDQLEAHHVLEQRVGPPGTPYAQKLKLGWVVVGEVCLGETHRTDTVSAYRTYIQHDGRPSLLKPCPSKLHVKEKLSGWFKDEVDSIGSVVFQVTEEDNEIGRSIEDKVFMEIMKDNFEKDKEGRWCAPLPFKPEREKLPNNRAMAQKRAKSLARSLERDENKKSHFTDFMQKLLNDGHAEVAPPLPEGQECWYLPVFGVYHPKKPGQIRCVFDSSATFGKQSLNSALLSGPDLNNSLLGVLMRFRKNKVAVSADIRQMFYSFVVREDHRDYLRFLWHKDNDVSKELLDYRMKVHVFGNSPSPSVAIYGLQKTADEAETDFGSGVKEFVQKNFYVDDGLTSLANSDQAVDLLKRTQKALLKHGNLRLHKFASNDESVMKALPPDDLAENLKNLDLKDDCLPLQRSLGQYWNLDVDKFTYQVTHEEKPFTRRGILSVVNSVYDPLGFVAPITIQGKLLLRKFLAETTDWDEPLPERYRSEWDSWCISLDELQNVQVPRMIVSESLTNTNRKELHVFSDASEKVIAAVCYLRTPTPEEESNSKLGFVLGKAKVAPLHNSTIPRLELCAAVLAVEVAESVARNLDEKLDLIKFYSDSRVVLGYINNETRRFYVYVANRVDRIRQTTIPEQWNFVPTSVNPADRATRPAPVAALFDEGGWLNGPKDFIDRSENVSDTSDTAHNLVCPEEDKDVRPISVKKTQIESKPLGTHRFERFSTWKSLINALVTLRLFLQSRAGVKDPERTVDLYEDTERLVIKNVQQEMFDREICCIKERQPLPKDSPILSLNPQVDVDGFLRVGGRLNHSDLQTREKNPIIMSGKHHVALLIVRRFHADVKHQGRHFTEGAVRTGGFWITGGKRLISSVIHSCVPCKKLRGKAAIQQMADLPEDRLDVNPPFTNVGVDTFGPWNVVTRRTRGGSACSKRWAILFTCLSTRAIHIELIEEMTSSAFINALRRFVALRGKVHIFRSDRGTNFVGAVDNIGVDAINIEDEQMKPYLNNGGTKWIFNPPHASHMGGAWERLIGVTRRILESMLGDISGKHLTHDVLNTFMAEVCAIVNNRPIVPVSSDPENPFVLSPATILTQKAGAQQGHLDDQAIDTKDLLRAEWKRARALSDMFWSRWRKEYIQTLQVRRKWTDNVPNVEEGAVVLLRDKSCCRNEWPLGKIVKTFKSRDGKVRSVEVIIAKDGVKSVFTRPIVEIVMLL